MRWSRQRALTTAFALACASCGYPEFGFGPAADRDGALDDTAVDSTLGDVAVDAADGASDSNEANDSSVLETSFGDSAADSGSDLGIDSSVDSRADSGVDSGADVADSADAKDAPDAACALIDDFEDGDGRVLVRCGRDGYWSTYNDHTDGGVQTPPEGTPYAPSAIPGGRGTSMFAGRTYGSGFTDYGAGTGFSFSTKGMYDGSAWGGIGFWARVGAGTATTLRMQIPNGDTDPAGGVCTSHSPGCYDHYGIDLTFTTDWKYYVVRYSDLRQMGWGWPAPPFDGTRISGAQMQLGSKTSFDFWIDDVTFVP